MGKILLVNTGPTQYERCGSYPVSGQGELDASPDQWAQAAADRLGEYQLSAVYYCPTPSAFETAEIVAKKFSLNAMMLPGMEDLAWSQWKGLEADEALDMDSLSNTNQEKSFRCREISGIDIEALRVKMAGALDHVAEQYKKETVAIIAHRAVTVVMILQLLDIDNSRYHQIAQENGAVNMFDIRAKTPSALYINDTCHLKSLL